MAFLPRTHDFLSQACTIFALLVTLFGLVQMARRQGIGGDFFGAVVIGECLILVQAAIGLVMIIVGLAPGRTIHILYGIVAVITWPAIFAYTRGGTSQRDMTLWTLASAFLFGIMLRASQTALPLGAAF